MAAQDLTWQLLPCRWKSPRTRAFVKRVESAALAARRGDAAFTGVSAFNRNHPSFDQGIAVRRGYPDCKKALIPTALGDALSEGLTPPPADTPDFRAGAPTGAAEAAARAERAFHQPSGERRAPD